MERTERRLSFTGSVTQVTHIIEMEQAHLERLQQQKPSKQSRAHKASTPLWKRWFGNNSGLPSSSNRTVNTACLSQSSSTRSVHNSPSFAEDFASSADGEEDDDESEVQLFEEEGAVELVHSRAATPKSNTDLCVPAHYTCCISPCESLDDVLKMVQLPSLSTFDDELEHQVRELDAADNEQRQQQQLPVVDVKELVREAQACMSMGDYERALHLFRRVMQDQEQKQPICPITMANVCYALTRCAFCLHDYDTAFHYAHRELYYTKQCGSKMECGKAVPTLAVAASYHELARICKVGLSDLAQALRYYRAALSTSHSCLERWQQSDRVLNCQQCQLLCKQGTTGRSLCSVHRAGQAEILEQIQDSKQCIGRIYFEMGNFDAAMRMI